MTVSDPYYWKASFCGPATNGRMLKLGVVLPFNLKWNPFEGVAYIDVSGSADWAKHYLGSNYKIEAGLPSFQREIVVEFNSTNFPADNAVYIRGMAVDQIVTVSLNLDFVEKKDNPQSILPGPSRIPTRTGAVYEPLVPYARLTGTGHVTNFQPIYYEAGFCNLPYPGQDWGVRAVVVAADDESAFATYLCSGDIPNVLMCAPGSEYVSNGGMNIDDSGINVIEVDTRRNPRMDFDKGVVLAVVGYGGAMDGNNEFYVQFTTFGL